MAEANAFNNGMQRFLRLKTTVDGNNRPPILHTIIVFHRAQAIINYYFMRAATPHLLGYLHYHRRNEAEGQNQQACSMQTNLQ